MYPILKAAMLVFSWNYLHNVLCLKTVFTHNHLQTNIYSHKLLFGSLKFKFKSLAVILNPISSSKMQKVYFLEVVSRCHDVYLSVLHVWHVGPSWRMCEIHNSLVFVIHCPLKVSADVCEISVELFKIFGWLKTTPFTCIFPYNYYVNLTHFMGFHMSTFV